MQTQRRINLCFHGIGEPARALEPGEDGYWITEEFFHAVLDLVRPRTDVELSFDDGNASDVRIGLPALVERDQRASFYPLAGRLDEPGSLATADLKALVAAGMEVGTHGMWHKPWRGLGDAELDEELRTARERISAASGAPVRSAACPLGSYDRRVIGRLRSLGYERVYTSDRSATRPSWWLQPRYSVRRGDDLDTVRGILAGPPGLRARLEPRARMFAKRWR